MTGTPPSPAVAVENVEKRFGATVALAGISFEAAAGELFGFVGPDGAGKTTLFRILATLLVPDASARASRRSTATSRRSRTGARPRSPAA